MTDYSVAQEGWRLQKPELMEFIRRQAGAGELVEWTVALINTDGKAGDYKIAGCVGGKAERKPEEGTWNTGRVPSLYATRNANIQSPSHQVLDLRQMKLDETLLSELLSKRTAEENGRPLFPPAEETLLRQCCAEQVMLDVAAEWLTALRKPPAQGAAGSSRINGEVARQLRPKTHGLLLIYPLIPKGGLWSDTESPFMGLAFSFPSSHTARSVDYKVNKVWQTTFHDEDYTDAD